jgi:hypothetical protein
MLSKLSRSLNKIRNSLVLGTSHRRSREKAAPTSKTKGKKNMDSLRTTILSYKQRRTMERRRRKTLENGVTFIRAPGITLLIVAQSSLWWRR